MCMRSHDTAGLGGAAGQPPEPPQPSVASHWSCARWKGGTTITTATTCAHTHTRTYAHTVSNFHTSVCLCTCVTRAVCQQEAGNILLHFFCVVFFCTLLLPWRRGEERRARAAAAAASSRSAGFNVPAARLPATAEDGARPRVTRRDCCLRLIVRHRAQEVGRSRKRVWISGVRRKRVSALTPIWFGSAQVFVLALTVRFSPPVSVCVRARVSPPLCFVINLSPIDTSANMFCINT